MQRRLLQQQLGLVDRRVENAAVLLNRKRAAKPLPAGIETFAEHKKGEQQMVSKSVGNVPDMISAPSPVALGGRIEKIRNRALVHRADQTERRRVRDSKVILPAPSKAGAYRKQTVQPTMFPTRYSRGELPCAIEHRASGVGAREQRDTASSFRLSLLARAGNALSWVCPLHNLDYEHYLPIFFDGVRCTEDPYKFMARQVRHSGVVGKRSSAFLPSPYSRCSHSMPRERTSCSRRRAAIPSASCLAFRALSRH